MQNKITKDKFTKIEKKYGHYASWAIWSEEGEKPKSNMDTKVFKNLSIFGKLHTNFILVALNISRPIETPFGNFHPNYSEATDYKTRFAIKNTPLWGSYMTDIIKDFEELSSGNMMSYLKENQDFEKENIQSFLDELYFIETVNPTLIAIGSDSYNIIKRNLSNKFKVIKIPHYANYTSKENYRDQILAALKEEN